MQFDPKEALKYAKLNKLTEGVSLTCGLEEMKDRVTSLGYKYIHTIHGSELASYFAPNLGAELMFGYIAQEPDGNYVVAIRSTATFMEVMHDISFWQIPNPIKKAHLTFVSAGFSAIYQSLKVIEPCDRYIKLKDFLESLCVGTTSKVTLVGHSLGGALVTLLALDLSLNTGPLHSPKVYTFGSPRVGDPLFAKLYNKHVKESFRIAEKWDPVTLVPIFPAYYHVDEKIQLKMKWTLRPMAHHHLSTYIELLESV